MKCPNCKNELQVIGLSVSCTGDTCSFIQHKVDPGAFLDGPMPDINIKNIIYTWIKANGYDGLYNDTYESCGCGGNSFMPDESCPRQDCVPAYKHKCPGPIFSIDSECDSTKGDTCYRSTKEPCEGK